MKTDYKDLLIQLIKVLAMAAIMFFTALGFLLSTNNI